MSTDGVTRDLIDDCLSRIKLGDYSAAFDLSLIFMGHLHEKDIELNLAVVQGLALLAKEHGCQEAAEFLATEWPDMQPILRKRWARSGFSDPDMPMSENV